MIIIIIVVVMITTAITEIIVVAIIDILRNRNAQIITSLVDLLTIRYLAVTSIVEIAHIIIIVVVVVISQNRFIFLCVSGVHHVLTLLQALLVSSRLRWRSRMHVKLDGKIIIFKQQR